MGLAYTTAVDPAASRAAYMEAAALARAAKGRRQVIAHRFRTRKT